MKNGSGEKRGKAMAGAFRRAFRHLYGTDETQSPGETLRTGKKKKIARAASILACIVAFTTTYALILPAVTLESQPVCGQEEHIHTDACYAYLDADGATVDPAVVVSLPAAGDLSAKTENAEMTLSSGSRGGYSEGSESNAITETAGISDADWTEAQTGDGSADMTGESGMASADASVSALSAAVDTDSNPAAPLTGDISTEVTSAENTGSDGHSVTALSADPADDADTDASGSDKPDSADTPVLDPTADDPDTATTDPEIEATTLPVSDAAHLSDTAQSARRVLICGQEEHQHSVECYPAKSDTSTEKISPKSILTGLFGYDHSQSVTVDGTTITAEYKEGVLPDGVTMQAVPVPADAYVGAVADAVGKENTEIKSFDITFLSDGQEIEPSGEVKITFQADFIAPDTDPAIVHITDDGSADLMDTKITDDTITLKTDSFSVYAISYTVDFHWEVNGKTYDFSMPGGGFVSFTDLVEVLGIAGSGNNQENQGKNTENASENDVPLAGEVPGVDDQDTTALMLDGITISEETRKFVEGVEKVEFSSPEFVWIGKTDSETTVGQLKDENELKVEYSAELTEAQIAQINGTSVSGGDWALISLKAFDTEESLTVTMKDGEVFTIQVTDAQIKKTVISASGETYEITVTYGEDAQIPDGAELKVEEILPEDERYEEYYQKSQEKVGAVDKTVVESVRDAIGNVVDAITGNDEEAREESEVQADSYVHIFDIEIWADGQKIEPAANVAVNIKLLDAPENMFADLQIVHFGMDGLEVMELAVNDKAEEAEGVAELDFVTNEFSVYAVISAINTNTEDLTGKTFAIVNTNVKEAVLGRQNGKNRLAASSVNLNNSYVFTDEITMWTFESAGEENAYYIKAPDNGYMHITNEGTAGLNYGWEQKIYVEKYNGQLRLRAADNNWALNAWDSSVSQGFGGGKWPSPAESFTLYSLEEVILVTGRSDKISLTDLIKESENGNPVQNVVIYTRLLNEARDGYDYYAVSSDCSLIPIYDIGDTIGWGLPDTDTNNMKWNFTVHKNGNDPLGFFDFQNVKTGEYLIPTEPTGLEVDDPDDTRDLGVNIVGWDSEGTYTGTIDRWDAGEKHYTGYTYDPVNKKIVPTDDETKMLDFYFAYDKPQTTQQKLHTVAAMSDDAIKITMYDFDGWNLQSGWTGLTPRSKEMTDVMGTGSLSSTNDGDKKGYPNVGLVSKTLVNGYPTATLTNRSLNELFNNQHKVSEANNIFVKQVYDETGYYSYDSSINYAYLDRSKNEFILYRELAAPSMEGDTTPSANKGNFFPFNSLEELARNNYVFTNRSALYDGDLQKMTPDNPLYGQTLYRIDQGNGYSSYFFGMTMEADFYQGPDGKDKNGNDIIYEFNGDDDMWLYIDDRLVLDIGGCHGAVSGTINFSTGEVHVHGSKNAQNTTLRAIFETMQILPDGKQWNNTEAEKWFDGDTFADYTKHSFKMFYMERGANASNLKLTFNLLTIAPGAFILEKKLPEDVQSAYGDQRFAYQVYVVDNNNNATLFDPSAATIKHEDGTDYAGYVPEYTAQNGSKYQHVFMLSPDEAITIPMLNNDIKYFVREIDLDTGLYKEVYANNDKLTEQKDGNNVNYYQTSTEKVNTRSRVTYKNVPEKTYDLQLEKLVTGPIRNSNDSFRFDVMLEDSANPGTFVPFNHGKYYIVKPILDDDGNPTVDDDGNPVYQYYKYQGGQLVQSADPVVYTAGTSGSIDGIYPGYLVLIRGLMPGTDFLVTENLDQYPMGYQYVSTVVENAGESTLDTPQTANRTAGNGKGVILPETQNQTDYKDALVKITNTSDLKTNIAVTKVWDGDLTEYNSEDGESTIVLYKVVGKASDMDIGKPSSQVKVTITADPAPVTNANGKITVTYTGKKNGETDVTGSFVLSNATGWTKDVIFDRGWEYNFSYQPDETEVLKAEPDKQGSFSEDTTVTLTTDVRKLNAYTYTFVVPQGSRPEKGYIDVTFNNVTRRVQASSNPDENWQVKFDVAENTDVSYSVSPDGKFVSSATLNPTAKTPAIGNQTVTITPKIEPLKMTVPVSIDWSQSTATVPDGTKFEVTLTAPGKDSVAVKLTKDDAEQGNPKKWSKNVELDRLDENGDPIVYKVDTKLINLDPEHVKITIGGTPPTISNTGSSVAATGVATGIGMVKVTVARVQYWGTSADQFNALQELVAKEFATGTTVVVTVTLKQNNGNHVTYKTTDGQSGEIAHTHTANDSHQTETFEVKLPDTPDNNYRIVVDDPWRDGAVLVGIDAKGEPNGAPARRRAMRMSASSNAIMKAPVRARSSRQTFYDETVLSGNDPGTVKFESVLYKDLPANAIEVESRTINGDGTYTWPELSTVDENGNPIYYYVVERYATGYADSMTVKYEYEYYGENDANSGTIKSVKITNIVTGQDGPETKSLTVKKEWDEAGHDTDKITFKLMQRKYTLNGENKNYIGNAIEYTETYTNTITGNGTVTISDLPVSEKIEGTTYYYEYYVVEDPAIEGFDTSYLFNESETEGDEIGEWVIINTPKSGTRETTEINVEKTWVGSKGNDHSSDNITYTVTRTQIPTDYVPITVVQLKSDGSQYAEHKVYVKKDTVFKISLFTRPKDGKHSFVLNVYGMNGSEWQKIESASSSSKFFENATWGIEEIPASVINQPLKIEFKLDGNNEWAAQSGTNKWLMTFPTDRNEAFYTSLEKLIEAELSNDHSDTAELGNNFTMTKTGTARDTETGKQQFGEIDATAGEWKSKLKNLPLYEFDNGQGCVFTYEVEEIKVNGEPVIANQTDLYNVTYSTEGDTTTITNTAKNDLINVKVEKKWLTPEGQPVEKALLPNTQVKFRLIQTRKYKPVDDVPSKKETTRNYVTSDADADGYYLLSSDNNIWKKTFDNLPTTGMFKDGNSVYEVAYSYKVEEIAIVKANGVTEDPTVSYTVSYAIDGNSFGQKGELLTGSGTITINNQSNATYELPSTGGSGTTLFTILGSILVMLSGTGMILWKKRRFMGIR